MRLRPLLLNTHLVVGLAAALPLFCIGLTGAILVFENPINDALNAKVTAVAPPAGAQPLSLRSLEDTIDRTQPGYRIVEADFGSDDRHAWGIAAVSADGKGETDLFLDPYTGKTLGRPEQQSLVMNRIHQFHTKFLAGRTGNMVTGWSGVMLAFLAVTGLILWWPAKIVRVRPGITGWRLAFDLHQTVGAFAWVLLLVLATSGMVIHWNEGASALAYRMTGGQPVAPFPRSVNGCEGRPILGIDSLASVARALVPGAHMTVVGLPDDPSVPVRAQFKYPEDLTPAGRTLVFLAACSGRPVQVLSSRTAPVAYRLTRMWNREIHTGDVLGWPGRIVMALASLCLPLMALTGPLMWWGRRKRTSQA
ncbi:MAG TPA: PepSY-associated TM helix domain-containing protein [Gemmatimonadales bacterium]|nr:PepSY-associated TM helix domain-containing protein [Gemmatimonadales bacterium]